MHTVQDAKRKISFRSLDVSEVTQLWEDGMASERNTPYWRETQGRYRAMLDQQDSWMGRTSFEALETMMRDGWGEGAARVSALTQRFAGKLPTPTSIRRRKVWSDQGDEMDRDRLYSGQVETCWRRTARMEVSAPQVISLVLPWCHSAAVEHGEMFWGAAAVLACADVLEDAGYQVELTACNPIVAEKDWLSVTNVTVKGAGEPMRMDSLAALTAHAASYRYYGIPSVAHVPTHVGWGWACKMIDIPQAVAKLVEAELMPAPFAVCDRAYNEAGAVRFIEGVISKLTAARGESAIA